MEKEEKKPNSSLYQGKRDNPEQYPTDTESLFDKFESERNVDTIPMEDLKMEQREEKAEHHTKDDSSSERKYNTGF
ncbi:hypothetical protein DRW41_01900 [Neobacillus piezotolerans]|uniref:Uncharacterized protein n=1 Tax=Neobacillus piezotolerans TaxID=2259171 RepID=A0A3D8GV38_9BACI|nr:hypothetical protein [Neobacillus piezotolerans]RDU38344.1 hypothetical protein DRW41_01900 [Neobacillus piezotolerans]